MTEPKSAARTKPASPQPVPLSRRDSLVNLLRGTAPRNLWGALGLLLVGLIVTALASFTIKMDVEAAAQREFDFTCNEIRLNIVDRLDDSAQILISGAALFNTSEIVSREAWQIFTQSLQLEQRLPGIQGTGFALLIPREQLAQHQQQIRGEGFPDYQVTPAGERELYSAIIYLEPFLGRNLRAFGYDMFSEAVRRTAMERARDENSPALSGKVILVQETGQDVQAGTLMYVPVYRHGLPIETIEQRRAAILGWVYSPYRMTDLMHGTLRGWDMKQKDRQITLQIYDGEVLSADTLLYDSQSSDGQTLASSQLSTKLVPVDFAGRRWTLRVSEFGGLASLANYNSVWLVLFGGAIISLLLFWLALSLLSTRANARRMAEQLTTELRESEEKYRVIFNNEIYAICIFDLKTLELLDVNEAYSQLYGYSREELVSGMTIHDITAEHQVSDTATQQAIHNGTIFIPLRYHRKKDGTTFPVEIVGGPYTWQGRKVMFALAHDITERKRAEKAIKENEARYRRLVESAPDVVYTLSTKRGGIYYSPYVEQLLGYSSEHLYTHPLLWNELIHPDDREQISAIRKFELGKPFDVEYRIQDAQGNWRWLRDRSIGRIIGADNEALIEGLATDITERKQAEQALRQSEARFRSFFDDSPIAVWEVDFSAVKQRLDTLRAEGLADFDTYLRQHPELVSECAELIHVLDINPATLILYEAASKEEMFANLANVFPETWNEQFRAELVLIASGNAHFQIEMVAQTVRGKLITVNMNWAVISGYENDLSKTIVSMLDISDRKLAEERLRISETRYRGLFESAKDGILILDAETGKIVDVNPFLVELLGYSQDQFLHKEIWEIGIFKDIAANQDKFMELQQKHYVRYEDLSLETAEGREINVEFISNVYFVDDKKVIQCNLRDISARKAAEQKIRSLNAELEKLALTDYQTNLYNRRYFMQRGTEEFKRAQRNNQALSLLMLDIDEFKKVNDTYGHEAGDLALKQMAASMKACLREIDLLGRLGGEEFAVILPNTALEDAILLADRVRLTVANTSFKIPRKALSISITVSIGVAAVTNEMSDIDDLLRNADAALYHAKHSGRNCVVS